MRRFLVPLMVIAAGAWAVPVAAQTDRLCFPETRLCIAGDFRTFWEANGGLETFGYPITDARPEINRDTSQAHLTQWFERNRFEMHPRGVMLGRLGDDRLRQMGIDWHGVPRAVPDPTCDFVLETGRNLCDQADGLGFRSYWLARGGLPAFGYPLTEARVETNASGDSVLTQWFERARMEWHPSNPDQFKVLLGHLGREVGPPVDGGVVVLSHQGLFQDGGGTLWVGEVRNDTPGPVEGVTVRLRFGGGAVERLAELPRLEPGQRSPFRVYTATIGRTAPVAITVEATRTAEGRPHGLEVVSSAAVRSSAGAGFRDITGQVRNPGAGPVYNPRVVATLYEADGKVRLVDGAGLSLDSLTGTTTFRIRAVRWDSRVARVEIQAFGVRR